MKFLEHIRQIDSIISERKEEQRKKALFDISSTSYGLDFTTITQSQCGSMSNVTVTQNNVNGSHTDTYTVCSNGCGGYNIY